MDTINFSTFMNTLNRKLEPPIKQHLKNVYGCMAMTLLMTSVGFYVHLSNILNVGFLSSFALLGLSIALATTSDDAKNHNKRLGYLMGFAFCSGLNLGPLLELAIVINPSIVLTAFLSTCFLFFCFSLSAIFSDQRKWLFLAGTLSSALSCLLFLSLANLFFGSKLLFQSYIYLSLFVMCGFVIYDTSLIIEKCRMGDTDYIWHTVLLLVDFLTIFKNILVILMSKEDNKNRKKK